MIKVISVQLLLLLVLSIMTATKHNTAAFSVKSSSIPIPSKVRAIIFDIDGTLVDSWRLGYDATLVVLRNNNVPVDNITPALYHECTRYATPERLARHVGLPPSSPTFQSVGDRLARDFDDLYVGLVSPSTAGLYMGINDFITTDIPSDVKVGALTNACVAYAHRVLEVHGLTERFVSVKGADNVPRPKPAPEGLLVCCEEMGVRPEECVYIGDSPSDGAAAEAAGMASIGVLWGSHSRESLMNAPFRHLCETVDELRQLMIQI